ncbi:MAG: hypothetical protein A2946_04000 [Candidatus Liptonbacteria bacterium RIFCSPLOWO2_01_FULL_53_13]|uniref:Tetratricopeptide repeat-like domain-containing protein n=1 Tax=Candidatus Liptonbacteria bacterium RIFCSPLOWO2_01_FULL_53_13 TaxID=1798651 RepID=A0A1G2CM09_9BACT|nr:MAG: hypothetical protein A2946_04000 [Candidatus Liptonbacteria bacterium RIFCSPLOWO2_01_FULL_53_13]
MNDNLKKFLGVIVSAAIVAIGIYGNYLPLRKSQIYISSTREAYNAKTLADFEKAISPALDAPSPIGQSELVRNVATTVMGIIVNSDQNTPLIDASLKYALTYYDPLIARGKGLSFEQDLYILGLIYQRAYLKTQNPKYLESALYYYKEGYARGPKRPQFLYGLFDAYRLAGDVGNVDMIMSQILKEWPGDDAAKSAHAQFKNKVQEMNR